MKRVLAAFFALTLAGAALAHDGHKHGDAPEAKVAAAEAVPETLPDAALVDQFGNRTRLHQAIGPGVYVLGFTAPDCGETCATVDQAFTELAQRDAVAAPLKLVTLTLDPASDHPENLLARQRALGAPEGWLWLTGDPAEILPLLEKLGATDAAGGFVIVGDAGQGQMTRLAVSPQLSAEIGELIGQDD